MQFQPPFAVNEVSVGKRASATTAGSNNGKSKTVRNENWCENICAKLKNLQPVFDGWNIHAAKQANTGIGDKDFKSSSSMILTVLRRFSFVESHVIHVFSDGKMVFRAENLEGNLCKRSPFRNQFCSVRFFWMLRVLLGKF